MCRWGWQQAKKGPLRRRSKTRALLSGISSNFSLTLTLVLSGIVTSTGAVGVDGRPTPTSGDASTASGGTTTANCDCTQPLFICSAAIDAATGILLTGVLIQALAPVRDKHPNSCVRCAQARLTGILAAAVIACGSIAIAIAKAVSCDSAYSVVAIVLGLFYGFLGFRVCLPSPRINQEDEEDEDVRDASARTFADVQRRRREDMRQENTNF